MRYFSMFSGVGTGEKGIEQAFANHYQHCIGYSEIDKNAIAIYQHNFPGHRNYGDANAINTGELPDFDLLIAGFPCQSFSIAGKREGFNDARGTLFFEIARILRDKRPRHFLLENVRGLLSHDKGKTVQAILEILTDLDYFVETVVVNSKDYGVPQNRERVFFIGHLGDECQREILSFGKNGAGVNEKDGGVRGQVSPGGRNGHSDLLNKSLSQDGQNGHVHQGLMQLDETKGMADAHRIYDGQGFRPMRDEASPSLNARARQDGSQQMISVNTERAGNRIYDADGIAATVTANITGGTKNERYQIENRIRRLTPTECERLQGCPDDWTKYGIVDGKVKEMSDTARYRAMGNSFTVNVIEAIVSKMLETGCIE